LAFKTFETEHTSAILFNTSTTLGKTTFLFSAFLLLSVVIGVVVAAAAIATF
jgi:hypothetical protein